MSNAAAESHWLEVSESEEGDQNEENIIQIIVASDINLGYEKTVKRDQEDDSFRTFEEILKYAVDYNVDAILLAGNLFYQSNPPLDVIMRCISLLRLYCVGQKAVKIDCITDPEWIFSHCPFKIVNFKDPNLNIRLPIFSVYGNRDNPLLGPIGSLDLLAATGLINYFGKWIDNDEISIPPLLLRKGLTTLALYGLNHMNDAKLSKLIKRDKLKLLQETSIRDIFNLLVLHQNRARPNRTENMFLSESLIPDMIDLIIWGHEPVCRVEHETVPNKTFRISQPGSTIATSLTRGETVRKKVGLLKIYKDSFQMKYLKLKTVRPFVFDSLNLNENNEIYNLHGEPRTNQRFGLTINRRTCMIEKFVNEFIEKTLLPRAHKQNTGHPKQPTKPLLRLKILHDNESDRFCVNKLAKKFQDLVANPNDMVVFSNSSLLINSLEDDDDGDDYEDLSSIYFKSEKRKWSRTVEGGMSEYFEKDENKDKLTVLPLDGLNKALFKFKRNDHASFERIVRNEIETTVNHLIRQDTEVEDALEAIQDYRNE